MQGASPLYAAAVGLSMDADLEELVALFDECGEFTSAMRVGIVSFCPSS